MRIDDLNRGSQTQGTEKTEATRPDQAKTGAKTGTSSAADAADISGAATALSPSEARLEALRLQVERGEYKVPAKEIARNIIDQHTTD